MLITLNAMDRRKNFYQIETGRLLARKVNEAIGPPGYSGGG